MSRHLYHNNGINPCGEKAAEFLPDQGPVVGQQLIASEWRKLNGESFQNGEMFICGSCGEEIDMLAVEDVK